MKQWRNLWVYEETQANDKIQEGLNEQELLHCKIIREKLEKLFDILKKLENEIPIPAEYDPHMLTGDYKGHMECHIEGDFLLIWFDPDTDEIDLVRLGSHSELFG